MEQLVEIAYELIAFRTTFKGELFRHGMGIGKIKLTVFGSNPLSDKTKGIGIIKRSFVLVSSSFLQKTRFQKDLLLSLPVLDSLRMRFDNLPVSFIY